MPASLDTPTASSDTSATDGRSTAGALAALSLSILLASLGTSGANVALPTLATEFSASFAAVQWIVLAYLLAVTTLIVGVGRLGDVVGRRRLLLGGLALFTAASLVSGLAPTLPVLVGARVAQGLGAATMMALAMAFVGDAVPPARTGRAMGLLGTMSAVGTALGPSLGGLLLAGPGWRALFLVNVPIGLVALRLVSRHLPEGKPAPASFREFDVGGTLLLASALSAFALAVTLGRGHLGIPNVAWLVGAAVSATLFVWRQARAASPLLPASLLRDRGLAAGLVTNALVACVMMSTLIVGPFYLTGALHLAPAVMGLVMTVGPVLTALAGVPAGRLVDQRGADLASLVGLTAMLVGSALLAALPTALGVAGYLGPILLLTMGYALFQAANNTTVMAHAGSSERGVIGGVLSLSRNLGLITGASLMGAVFVAAAGVADITVARPAAVASGMRITFALAAMLVVVAGVLTAGRRVSRVWTPRDHASRRASAREACEGGR